MTTTLHPKDQEVLDSLHISCLPFAEQRVYLDRILEALATMGSKAAVKAGCSCPVLDNVYGLGYVQATDTRPAQYIYHDGCPVHAPRPLPTPGVS